MTSPPKPSLDSSLRSLSTTGSERSSQGSLTSLHGSLMRSRKEQDPNQFYQCIKMLGEGSMGSVQMVKRRKDVIGGSARSRFVESEKMRKIWCWGSLFLMFCPPREDDEEERHRDSFLETIHEDTDADSSLLISVTEPNFQRQISTLSSSSSIISHHHKDVMYALKSIHIARVRDSVFKRELMNEIAILQTLDHPHIVKAIETFDYHDRLFLVLELCSGGDLYSRDPYSEKEACQITHALVDAVNYMHSKGITHRDLKFENIMFSHPSSFSIKVIDFGLSKKYAMTDHLHETVGTVYTMAPEVLTGDYDNKADLWSIGVIAYMLLSSSLPFYGKSRKHVVRRILQGKWSFREARWNLVSYASKDFISSLLVTDIEKRPSAEETLQMTWLRRNNVHAPVSFVLMDKVTSAISSFAEYSRFKKLALNVVAYKYTEEEIGYLRRIFEAMDANDNGEIELDEFKAALAVYHYSDEELERLFAAMDMDMSGKVHYSEFLAATIEAHGSIEEEHIADAFDRLDCDDSGYITVKNIQDFLGKESSKEYIGSIIDEVDVSGHHEIGYKEFLHLWNENSIATLQSALADVYKRRETFESTESTSGNLSTSTSFSTLSGGDDRDSSIQMEPIEGGYFFEMEKQRSLRGVWFQ